jgi:hypothetical protein
MEIDEISSPIFYRKLLNSAKIFLTEVDGRSSTSVNESVSRSQSRSSLSPSSSVSINNRDINKDLISTRQECHQRLLTCSRKKLRLLSLQEQVRKKKILFLFLNKFYYYRMIKDIMLLKNLLIILMKNDVKIFVDIKLN